MIKLITILRQPTTIIILNIILFYSLLTLYIQSRFSYFPTTPFAYYNYLLDAFFHGRVNLISPMTHDLSFFQGMWYLYWGPASSLFILPFYMVGGIKSSDVIYTLFAGILNVVLFTLVINQFTKYFNITISFFKKFFIIASFAFLSPNLYLTVDSRIWSTYHIIAIFYLLTCYYFIFKTLNSIQSTVRANENKHIFLYITLSIIFFNLAWFSRYALYINFILFIYVFIILRKYNVFFKKILLLFLLITGFFVSVFFIYNYAKFTNPFQTGFRYQVASERSNKIMRKHEEFSLRYIPYNLKYYFLHTVSFLPEKPFLKIDTEGNSIFSVYPAVILIFLLFQKKYRQDPKVGTFLLFSGSIIGISFFSLLTFFSTGWDQFGMRYFFDLIPLVYLLLLFVINKVPNYVLVIILSYGAAVNILGSILFSLRLYL